MPHNLFNSLQTFAPASGKTGQLYSLPQLEKEGVAKVSRLPVSIRIVLESVLRNFDGQKITEDDVRSVANWRPNAERTEEVPFVVARVLLQDFTGVPLLVDLAAMRSAVLRLNKNPGVIPPGIGICHQVNLEFLGKCVWEKNDLYYPDSLVGTDSHTTMINGLGIVGWGVGGIEAEAAMLGQPVYFLTPDVVGVHMSGKLREGVTAKDLV